MTTTLLKHEFRRTIKPVSVIFGLTTLLVLASMILGFFSSVLFLVLTIIIVSAFVFVWQIYLAVDFYRATYGSGAIMTHTLPVSGRHIFWTRLLWALIATVAAAVFVGLLGLIVYLTFSGLSDVPIYELGHLWNELWSTVPGRGWFLTFNIIFIVVHLPVTMLFVVVAGSTGPLRHLGVGGPVVAYVGYYLVTQILAMGGLLIPFSIDPTTFHIVWQSMFPAAFSATSSPELIPLGIYAPFILLTFAMMPVAAHCVDKKLELR